MHKIKNDNKKFFRGNNSNGRNFIDRKTSFILAFGFIISALILGCFFVSAKSEQYIRVVGQGMKTVNSDSFLIRSELVYKYYPGRKGESNYHYNISLNTDKIVDPIESNLTLIASIGYNDSVSFADYKAFLGGCHFPDKDEFEKKLATRKKKEEKQIQ